MAKLKGILLTEGMHGMISQVEGLAKALDIDFTHHKVELNHFWKLIPPNLSPVSQRVFKKIIQEAPHETLLVLDSSIGQNSLSQARLFNEALDVNGIVMTKLDGSAKGGVLFSIARELKLPVRFIGVGEQVDDLQPFDPRSFVDALFD